MFFILIPYVLNTGKDFFFSHSVDCLFILVTFNLMQSHLSILALISWAISLIQKMITYACIFQSFPYYFL
jgi:hypothetical protein